MENKIAFIPFALCFLLSLPLAFAQNEDAASPFASETAWIAYQTERGGRTGVWLIHPDGTDDHQIASDVFEYQGLPDWSPDGTRLAFTTRGGETEPLYEYDLATQTSRELFACEDPCVGYDEPAYSPDGTKVAFIRYLGPFVNDGPSPTAPWPSATWQPARSPSSRATPTRSVTASTSRVGLPTARG
jgi:Tol biopolymer transport system component